MHNPGVARPQAFPERHRVAQPVPLPCRLGNLQCHEVSHCLGEWIAVRPVGERGPGANRGDMNGVAGLMQQLAQIVQSAGSIGGKDPRLPSAPLAIHEPGTGAESGVRHRRLALARLQLIANPKLPHVGTERAVHSGIELTQPRAGDARTQRSAGCSGHVVPVPRLDRGVRVYLAPRIQHRLEPRLQRVGRYSGGARLLQRGWALGAGHLPRDQHSIGTRGIVGSVHAAPYRIQREEESTPRIRGIGAAQCAQDREPVEGVANIHENVGLGPCRNRHRSGPGANPLRERMTQLLERHSCSWAVEAFRRNYRHAGVSRSPGCSGGFVSSGLVHAGPRPGAQRNQSGRAWHPALFEEHCEP